MSAQLPNEGHPRATRPFAAQPPGTPPVAPRRRRRTARRSWPRTHLPGSVSSPRPCLPASLPASGAAGTSRTEEYGNRFRALAAATAITFAVLPGASAAEAAATSTHYTGSLTDGATWVADVPASWNGTTILYSHGFGPLTPADAPDPATQADLLHLGYALVGSSYSGTS